MFLNYIIENYIIKAKGKNKQVVYKTYIKYFKL